MIDPRRAMSEAGSLMSETMDSAGHAAAEMMRLPLTVAGVGVTCMCARTARMLAGTSPRVPFSPTPICLVLVHSLAPLILALLTPLILLLTPLLLPVGFGLTVFGLGRAGLIATLRTGDSPARARRRRATTDELDDDDDASVSPTRVHSSRSSPDAHPLIEMKHGTFSELNQLAGKRAEHLVKQVGHLVRHNISKATKEVSGEVGATHTHHEACGSAHTAG